MSAGVSPQSCRASRQQPQFPSEPRESSRRSAFMVSSAPRWQRQPRLFAAGGPAGAVPATYLVDTNLDGAGECGRLHHARRRKLAALRDAIEAANAHAGADIINFFRRGCGYPPPHQRPNDDHRGAHGFYAAPAGTGSAVDGTLTPSVVVDAQGNSRIFYLDASGNADITISGLKLQNGSLNSRGGGAAIHNEDGAPHDRRQRAHREHHDRNTAARSTPDASDGEALTILRSQDSAGRFAESGGGGGWIFGVAAS